METLKRCRGIPVDSFRRKIKLNHAPSCDRRSRGEGLSVLSALVSVTRVLVRDRVIINRANLKGRCGR